MITGAVKTTPVAALEQYWKYPHCRRNKKEQSANTFVTIKALEDETWIETKPKIPLSTQKSQ
jgi:hypothetical protein